LMESTRADIKDWPLQSLERYIDWIEILADPDNDPELVLGCAAELEQELRAAVTS